jgi:hemolysin III
LELLHQLNNETGRSLSLGEEIANSVTHGVGVVLSLIALPTLVVVAARRHDTWQIVGGAVFGTTLLLLYCASTLYHAIPLPRVRSVFRVLDHAAIYLLIAGTYTPFALGALRGTWGWSLLIAVWALAALGIVLKATRGFQYAWLSTAVYLAMGWLIVVAIRPLTAHIGLAGLAWLLAGGLAYTLGVIFFAWDRLRYGHMVWHLFVLAGSICHFVAVLRYAGA